MSMVDLLTICSFIGVLLLGVMALTVQDMRNNQPQARIKTRMQQAFSITGVVEHFRGTLRSARDRFILARALERAPVFPRSPFLFCFAHGYFLRPHGHTQYRD